ncbi:hypothetical protein PYCCODRAFT_1446017 [Trametes coccinea BRFM310]|uniref:Uncharacterized protein n=1 Tax=Trametes coccinea (strain BRFM310) TaxID=1353009 RepID=A0A1Y2IIA5_TRAC3|nr:hypothetical protein PYCCODRAFT_1446017 [Trametes coccinea BRFM310]
MQTRFLSLHSPHARAYKLPKEAKEPLFCCGARHKSANYHKRTVHQQHTKIYWKDHPQASFILRRNTVTSLFHCPKCDKSWAMATPIRNHIFYKCEGYAQYRSSASATGGGLDADQSASSMDSSDSSVDADAASMQGPEVGSESGDGMDMRPSSNDYNSQRTDNTSLSASSTIENTSVDRRSHVQVLERLSSPNYQAKSAPEKATYLTPVLRPAIWSPVAGTSSTADTIPTARGRYSAAFDCGRPLILTPELSRSASSSSKSSARTVPDDVCLGSRATPYSFKPDPDAAYVSSLASRTVLSGAGTSSSYHQGRSASQEVEDCGVRAFLDSLPRRLGSAAPLFYKLGISSHADLDLLCTMPETWQEVGSVLQAGGITMIEWLMVKEALRLRAM